LLINCKPEERDILEAALSSNKNVGFVTYKALAGWEMLTGETTDGPAALDSAECDMAIGAMRNPQGRTNKLGWSRTL
jgi:hypothetical protein